MADAAIWALVQGLVGGGIVISIGLIILRFGVRKGWGMVERAVNGVEKIGDRLGDIAEGQDQLHRLAEVQGETLRDIQEKVS